MSFAALNTALGQRHRTLLSVGILTVFYTVGLVGALLPLHPDFMRLTPLNLLLSAGLLLWNDVTPRGRLVPALAIAFSGGMAVEWLGVHTGLPFGNYVYGGALGPKLAGVPLTIGLNWMMLLCCTATLAQVSGSRGHWSKAAIGALAMTAFDVLLEPVAVRHDFWTWQSPALATPLFVAPLQNYLGWFGAAFLLHLAWLRFVPQNNNPLGIPLLALQSLFFLVLFLF